jgi:hypothetical protein
MRQLDGMAVATATSLHQGMAQCNDLKRAVATIYNEPQLLRNPQMST